MIWEDVVKEYGPEMAEKMKNAPFLQAITLTLLPDGKVDIPESDIDRAYRWATGKPVGEWD